MDNAKLHEQLLGEYAKFAIKMIGYLNESKSSDITPEMIREVRECALAIDTLLRVRF